MYRRAYALLIGVAVGMALLTIVTALVLDRGIADPDGFLGPAWVRAPMLVIGAFLADVLPRTLWQSRFTPAAMRPIALERIREHWTRERITLVVLGVVCFYTTYVSYRNLKSFLPFVIEAKYDRELHMIDRSLFFGHEPAEVLHTVLGTSVVAHVLSLIYLVFLPAVPVLLTAWLIWSKNISFGYWFVTSQVIAWTLGTASYYALPTLGPGFEYPWLYEDLADTGTTTLMDALDSGRDNVTWFGIQDAVQSVAGFASLHVAITLVFALVAQYTIRSRLVHWVLWVNFALTIVATLYFGWHYVADDIAGVVIALVSFYVGGVASGQVFDRHGLASHPTTETSLVPVEVDGADAPRS